MSVIGAMTMTSSTRTIGAVNAKGAIRRIRPSIPIAMTLTGFRTTGEPIVDEGIEGLLSVVHHHVRRPGEDMEIGLFQHALERQAAFDRYGPIGISPDQKCARQLFSMRI